MAARQETREFHHWVLLVNLLSKIIFTAQICRMVLHESKLNGLDFRRCFIEAMHVPLDHVWTFLMVDFYHNVLGEKVRVYLFTKRLKKYDKLERRVLQ